MHTERVAALPFIVGLGVAGGHDLHDGVFIRAPTVSVSGQCLDTNFCPTGPVISGVWAKPLKNLVRFHVKTLSGLTYGRRSETQSQLTRTSWGTDRLGKACSPWNSPRTHTSYTQVTLVHAPALQVSLSVEFPVHPPRHPSHVRVRRMTASPHVTGHAVQLDQADQAWMAPATNTISEAPHDSLFGANVVPLACRACFALRGIPRAPTPRTHK